MVVRLACVVVLLITACGDDDGFRGLPDAPPGDIDADSDGVANDIDNCPLIQNPDQLDTDGDHVGNACDDDDDNDGILDDADNCPLVPNPDQADTDGNGTGDACTGDADGDGVADASDNCMFVANADQLDTDADLLGDACDPDDDNDTILDAADNCALVANPAQDDLDSDGLGDACDPDDDNDTIVDGDDNCPTIANQPQADLDADGLGDACDPDDDNDTILDGDDNCPRIANADQANLDGDSLGDACDPDDDNDSVVDSADNCPRIANPGQQDANANGVGDACDTPTSSNLIRGGNLLSIPIGFAGGSNHNLAPTIDLRAAGLPATATVLRASLYWTVIGAAAPSVTVLGTAVTGTELGQTGTTCSRGNNFMYVADVTQRVLGSATFSFALPSTLDSKGQGASLVLTYADAADPRNNFVAITDGAFRLPTGASVASTVATGFTVGAGFDKVTAIDLMANGQPFADVLGFQSASFGEGPTFSGPSGAMWDNRVVDVSSAVHGGETTLTTTVTSGDTCLAWSMSAIVIEDADDLTAD